MGRADMTDLVEQERVVIVAQKMLEGIQGDEIGVCLQGAVMALLKVSKTFLNAIPERNVRQSVADSLMNDIKDNLDRIIFDG
jgi:hypothetical protein